MPNGFKVKSGDDITLKSLKKFKDTFKNTVNNGIVLYDGDIKTVDDILYLPLFMIDYLKWGKYNAIWL